MITSIATAVMRYLLDTRTEPWPGLPDATSSSDPYLRELLELYPRDIYPGGRYYHLPYGRTKVWKFGRGEKGQVLLVPGIGMPAIIWQPVANGLAEAGFEVATFDLFGRGYSDAPQINYHAEILVYQILGVLDKLGWRDPVYIAGLSMGGPLVTHFSSLFPERVQKVALLAPVGFMTWPTPLSGWGKNMITGRLWNCVPAFWPLQRAVNRYKTPVNQPRPPPESSERLERIVALQSCVLPGFMNAVIRGLNEGPPFEYRKPYYALAKTDLEVLVIWATGDEVVPYETSEPMMTALGSRARLVTIQGGGHDLPICNTKDVLPELLKFFVSD